MNKLYCFLTLIILAAFTSCNCDKTYNCPALSANGQSWISFNINDSIKFVNAGGQHINFIVKSKTLSPSYESKACKHGPLGCTCSYRCEASGYITGESNTFINSVNSCFTRVDEGSDNSGKYITSLTLKYNIFDFYGKGIDILNTTNLNAGDSLISSMQLGNHAYSNVYIQSNDTLTAANQNKRIWKAYFTREKGIVGFWERLSQSLYYRE